MNAQDAARQVSSCSDQVAQRTQAQIKDFTASVSRACNKVDAESCHVILCTAWSCTWLLLALLIGPLWYQLAMSMMQSASQGSGCVRSSHFSHDPVVCSCALQVTGKLCALLRLLVHAAWRLVELIPFAALLFAVMMSRISATLFACTLCAACVSIDSAPCVAVLPTGLANSCRFFVSLLATMVASSSQVVPTSTLQKTVHNLLQHFACYHMLPA